MDYYIAIATTIGPILLGLLGTLFVRSFLPTYFSKKAENLATKEDIAAITKEIEEVRHSYMERRDLSLAERDFYEAMTKNIWDLLSAVKRYEFENGRKVDKAAALADPILKEKFLCFVDSANEILGRAFIFLSEEHYMLLNDAVLEKGNLNDMAKNMLLAMRKSIHPTTRLNKDVHIRELGY